MAKYIKITQESLEAVRAAFNAALSSTKSEDGKISFSYNIGTVDRKAIVYFTEEAWLKMTTLIRECDKEVGWHGIATRGSDESKDEYFIHDIIVYPQEVTGSTVTPDQNEYQTWLYSHEDDVFNNIRMQGHSHVNMGVTPSGVDTNFYGEILSQLDDSMFYIFMIWNKRAEKTVKIYDLKKNILFETADCTVKVLPGELGLEKFLTDARAMVREKKYTPATGYKPTGTHTGYNGYNNYGSYGSNHYGSGNGASSNGGAQSGNAASFAGKKEDKPSNITALPPAKGGKHKGKRKGKRTTTYGTGYQSKLDLEDASLPPFDDDFVPC